ncbi:MAG: YfiR family protein [Pseudomonadota bacterium]
MLILSLFAVGGLSASYAATQTSAKEYQIKAVYLSKLIHFVTWPEEAFNSSDAPYQLCILGEDPFKYRIDIVFRNKKIKNRNIEINRLQYLSESDSCHILFISQSHVRQISFIVDTVQTGNKSMLTVSDTSSFINQGGMIELYNNRKRQVRLAIDPETLQEAGLKVSANLLRISRTNREQ